MARKTLLQVRRDTAANWTSVNPTPASGEPCFETDTGKLKIGDGSTAWISLGYISGTGGGDVTTIGTAKLYDYEVSGADKASIDTFVDGTTAANFAGYDLLEIWLYARTDEAVVFSNVKVNLNNDTGTNYDRQYLYGANASTGAQASLAQTGWTLGMVGSSAAANYFSLWRFSIPNYLGTVGYKIVEAYMSQNDSTAANNQVTPLSLGYRSTSAITRFACAAPSTKKFKIGTRLMVFGFGSVSGVLDGGAP